MTENYRSYLVRWMSRDNEKKRFRGGKFTPGKTAKSRRTGYKQKNS